ncbi:hypothetical protein L2E82_17028 [Cichorium intybus]|uniref:Uncharacterized protein n=1 Tax=Cichorium intybus TaxID=13427 RepID=A0ACB9F7S7_CICIN|nr:hypothetical protein L2E82_17028 [Cichorium intybus]
MLQNSLFDSLPSRLRFLFHLIAVFIPSDFCGSNFACRHILGVKVTYHDIEAIDPGYFKNLKWMLENDISDILDLTFSIDADEEKLILCERTEANTEYSGYSAASPVIQWFWEVAQGFSKEDKARLLQFVTGTSKVRDSCQKISLFLWA